MDKNKSEIQMNNAKNNANLNLQNSFSPKNQGMPPRPAGLPPRPGAKPPVLSKEQTQEKPKEIEKTKKQKTIKAQKEKQPKQKKELSKQEIENRKALFKKVGIISGVVVVAAVAIYIAITMILTVVYNNAQLEILEGQTVEVVNFNSQYYLQVPENEEAVLYIFEIKQDSQEAFEMYSNTNSINVSTYFALPAEFQIRYYIQKESEKSKSEPSQWMYYVSQVKINASVLTYNEQEKTLEYNYVENADSYEFFYSTQEGIASFTETPILAPEDNGRGSVSISSIEYGVYEFIVVAHPQTGDLFYTSSNPSNTVTVNHFGQREAPQAATYNLTNQTVTIDASNLTELPAELRIVVGGQEILFSPQTLEDEYVIDLEEHSITLTLGMSVYVVSNGDNLYILDSNQVVATPET